MSRNFLGELRGRHVRAHPLRPLGLDSGHGGAHAGAATGAVGGAIGGGEPGDHARRVGRAARLRYQERRDVPQEDHHAARGVLCVFGFGR